MNFREIILQAKHNDFLQLLCMHVQNSRNSRVPTCKEGQSSFGLLMETDAEGVLCQPVIGKLWEMDVSKAAGMKKLQWRATEKKKHGRETRNCPWCPLPCQWYTCHNLLPWGSRNWSGTREISITASLQDRGQAISLCTASVSLAVSWR